MKKMNVNGIEVEVSEDNINLYVHENNIVEKRESIINEESKIKMNIEFI